MTIFSASFLLESRVRNYSTLEYVSQWEIRNRLHSQFCLTGHIILVESCIKAIYLIHVMNVLWPKSNDNSKNMAAMVTLHKNESIFFLRVR